MNNRGTRVLLLLLAIASASACTSSTFFVNKDGKGYYWGNDSKDAYKTFCESGDLMKIIADTELPQATKEDLYLYNCGAERSPEKARQLYASMTPSQRKALRNAFKKHGYDINYLPCC
jgi:hypothetical protein